MQEPEAAPQLTEKGRLPISRSVFKRQCEPSGAMTDVARCVFVHTGTERRETGETDISTEQAGAQTPPRFPRPHGNQGRAESDRSPSRAWPQTAQRLTAPGVERLRRRLISSQPRPQKGSDRGIRPAGAQAQRRGSWSVSASPFEKGWNRRRAQSGTTPAQGGREVAAGTGLPDRQ